MDLGIRRGALVALALLAAPPALAERPITPYEEQHRALMGAAAPPIRNLSEGAAFPNAVYANRSMARFAIVSWGFAPSTTPFAFEEDIQPLSEKALAHLAATNTDGYIVVKNGAILHEYYARGMNRTTRHAAHEVGRSWTSAVWHAVLLPRLDKTVDSLVPQARGTVYQGVRLRSVVDMRVAIDWPIYGAPGDHLAALLDAALGRDYRRADFCLLELAQALTPDETLNGGTWHPVPTNTLVMGRLGAFLAGINEYEGIRRFYDALGLQYGANQTANLCGEGASDNGQSFTLRDFVKLPYAMANEGMVAGRQVLSPAYFADVFAATPSKEDAWNNGGYAEALPDIVYFSNQWYVVDSRIAFGIGAYGQFIVFNRKKKIAIAKFSTYDEARDLEMMALDIAWLIKQARRL